MFSSSRNIGILLALATLLPLSLALAPRPITIKLATLAPVGSPWYDVLEEMTREWEQISDGRIKVKIYPGGVVGDERDMITKMRLNHLHAAAMTATGISEIDNGIWGFSIPMVVQEYNQLDWLRAQIEDELARRLEEAGFVVLTWVDVGWAYWFGRDPIYTPQDLKKQRIFTWSGGPNIEGLWKSGGFHSVSVAATDILPAFQTGLIDAVGTTPLIAATFQLFGIAKYMNPIKWTVMTGGVLITKQMWELIPTDLQPKILAATHKHQDRIKNEVRHMDDEVIRVMKEYGLEVLDVTPEHEQAWRDWIEPHLPKLRGLLTDEAMFDWIMDLRKNMPPPIPPED